VIVLTLSEDLVSTEFLTDEMNRWTRAHGSIAGRLVAVAAFVAAVGRYGTQDYVLCPMVARTSTEVARLGHHFGIPVIHPRELATTAGAEAAVVHEVARHRLHRLAALRAASAEAWGPITAQAHGLGYPDLVDSLCLTLLGPVTETDAIFCPSRACRRVLERAMAVAAARLSGVDGQVRMPALVDVGLGIDTDRLMPMDQRAARRLLDIPPDDLVLLWFGRLSPVDKLDLVPVLRAFAATRARYEGGPDLRLLIAGAEDEPAYVELLSTVGEALDIGKAVQLVTDVDNRTRTLLYSSADVFLALSDTVRESFGLTVAEALCLGLPVIAADWDGYPELVVDGENGMLVRTWFGGRSEWLDERYLWAEPQDASFATAQGTVIDVDSLTQVMARMVTLDPAARRRMGARAAAGRAELSLRTMVRRSEAVWAELAGRPREPSAARLPGFGRLNLAELFQDYATVTLSGADVVTATRHGLEVARSGAKLIGYRRLWTIGFDRELAHRILCAAAGSADPLAVIAEQIGCTEPSKLQWHALWLAKQGYVTLARAG
jgi:glycosyltransferase involved in cell wall biosynthesis